VAVLDFEGEGISSEESLILSNRFRSELIQTGSLGVINRDKMITIMKNLGFEEERCRTISCAAEVGKILNVDHMIAGRIGRLGNTYTINISLINIESEKIAKTLVRDYSGRKDGILLTLTQMAEQLTEYVDKGERKSNLWWWVGGGGVVVGTAAILLLTSGNGDGDSKTEKLPGAEEIWPPR
jgi:hypothetical protein